MLVAHLQVKQAHCASFAACRLSLDQLELGLAFSCAGLKQLALMQAICSSGIMHVPPSVGLRDKACAWDHCQGDDKELPQPAGSRFAYDVIAGDDDAVKAPNVRRGKDGHVTLGGTGDFFSDPMGSSAAGGSCPLELGSLTAWRFSSGMFFGAVSYAWSEWRHVQGPLLAGAVCTSIGPSMLWM